MQQFQLPGIKNLTDWIAPGENVTDETKYWNFYETFETKKAYTPNNTLMLSLIHIYPDGNSIGVGRIAFDSETAREFIGHQGAKPFVHYDYLYLD